MSADLGCDKKNHWCSIDTGLTVYPANKYRTLHLQVRIDQPLRI